MGRPVANPAEFEGQWPWWGRWVGQWPTLPPPPLHLHGQWPTLPSPPVSTNLNNNWYNSPVWTIDIELWARLGHELWWVGQWPTQPCWPPNRKKFTAHQKMRKKREVCMKLSHKCDFGPERGAGVAPVPPPGPPGQNSTKKSSAHQNRGEKCKVCTEIAHRCKFGPEWGAEDTPVPPPLPTGAKCDQHIFGTPKNGQKAQSLDESGT